MFQRHHLQILRSSLQESRNFIQVVTGPRHTLPKYLGKQVDMILYFIDHKVVPTVKDNHMSFGAFIDEDMDWVDSVHFSPAFNKYPLKGRGTTSEARWCRISASTAWK